MGRPPYTEKGSCRHLLYNNLLSDEDLLCSVCKSHTAYTDRNLRKEEKLGTVVIKGVCHQLHGPLSQPTVARREEVHNSTGRVACKRRSDAMMQSEKENHYKPDNARTARSARKRTKKNTDATEEKRHVLQRLVGDSVNINWGGTSRTAILKVKQTAGKVLNEASKVLMPHNPELARDLAIASAISLEPTLQRRVAATVPRQRERPTNDRRQSTEATNERINEAEAVASVEREKRTASGRKKDQLRKRMGSVVADELENMTTQERRPILAAYTTRDNWKIVETVADIKISKHEWQKIRINNRWPGPFMPVVKIVWHRQRISTQILIRFLELLEQQPGYLQRVAFGVKVESILNGAEYATMDAVSRTQKLSLIAADFLLALDQEVRVHDTIPDSCDRCQHLECDTMRRCIHPRNHKEDGTLDRCKFTVRGSISKRTVEEFTKTLTTGSNPDE
eukprot:scaffold62029_cov65-Attheya_sp.AAC.8